MSISEVQLTANAHVRPLPHVISTCHGDRTILLNARNGRYYTLNAVGGEVWAALCANQSLGAIINQLADRYCIAPDKIGTDVDRLLSRLLTASLVECQ